MIVATPRTVSSMEWLQNTLQSKNLNLRKVDVSDSEPTPFIKFIVHE